MKFDLVFKKLAKKCEKEIKPNKIVPSSMLGIIPSDIDKEELGNDSNYIDVQRMKDMNRMRNIIMLMQEASKGKNEK